MAGHPNLIAVVGPIVNPPTIDGPASALVRGLLLECVPIDVDQYLTQHPGTPLPTRLMWLSQIAAALAHVHSSGHVHGDVVLRNIGVSPDGAVAKLGAVSHALTCRSKAEKAAAGGLT